MGRKKKYLTKEEQIQANRNNFMKHYWKNQEEIKQKNLKRYYEKKKNNN